MFPDTRSSEQSTSSALVCPDCEKGVRPEWKACPWCYAGRFEGNGRQGIETTMHFINTTEIRDGLAYRFDSQAPTEEVLRELGLD